VRRGMALRVVHLDVDVDAVAQCGAQGRGTCH
jgi:hypothetical protein